jgi:hypothetical protein
MELTAWGTGRAAVGSASPCVPYGDSRAKDPQLAVLEILAAGPDLYTWAFRRVGVAVGAVRAIGI